MAATMILPELPMVHHLLSVNVWNLQTASEHDLILSSKSSSRAAISQDSSLSLRQNSSESVKTCTMLESIPRAVFEEVNR